MTELIQEFNLIKIYYEGQGIIKLKLTLRVRSVDLNKNTPKVLTNLFDRKFVYDWNARLIFIIYFH